MRIAALLLAATLTSHTFAAEPGKLDPDLDYQAERSKPVTHNVDFSVVVTPPYHTKVLKVWLPLAQTNSGQEVLASKLTTFPMDVAPQIGIEPKFGNKFAYFEFQNPQGAQIIRHRFEIKVWELRWNLEPEKVVLVTDWPVAFDGYRQGEGQAVEVDQRFNDLLSNIVPTPQNPLQDMSAVMDWVIKDFTYDPVKSSLQASSVNALINRSGNCSDYHGFCASMGRVMGYPTRVTYGLAAYPKNSPSHCKLESFIPPYGWVSFDVSETQKLIASIQKSPQLDSDRKHALAEAAKQRLLGGYRENTWFIQTRGTDYELAPPASRRVALIRTAYVEADGQPLPEPDPSNVNRREFAWMTVHKYSSDSPVANSFKDLDSLGAESGTR